MITYAALDIRAMEMETVSLKAFKLFVLMDLYNNQMENVFFLQLYAMLDMKVMEMEIVYQLQYLHAVQMDMRAMEMEIVY
jgi:hypothetical protein